MHKSMIAMAIAMLIAAAPLARAQEAYLVQDLGTVGQIHYCRYSDQKTYTTQAYEACPQSVQSAGYGYTQTGYYVNQYVDGATLVCMYNVNGHMRALRVDTDETCPTSYDF